MDWWTWLLGPGDRCCCSGENSPHPTLAHCVSIQQAAPSLVLLPEARSRSSAPACTLRSRPVLNVGVAMRFMPAEVPKVMYQCWGDMPSTLEAGNATVCLTIHKSSLDQLGGFLPSGRSPLSPQDPKPTSGENGLRNPGTTSTASCLPV